MLDRDPLPSSPSTATDLADLERLLDAKPSRAIAVEELSSAHLEIEDESDAEIAVDNDDILDVAALDARMDLPAYAADLPLPAPAPIDLASTVQSVASPFVPEAPKTSPVPVAEDPVNFTQPFRRPAAVAREPHPLHEQAPLAEDRASFTQPFRRPSSIAPVAMDVSAARPAPARADSTLPIAQMSARHAETVITRLPPKTNIVPWVIAASIIGLFLAGGGVIAAVATSSASQASSKAASISDAARAAPRTAEITAAKSSQTDETVTASSIAAHGEKVAAAESPLPTNGEPVSVNALPTVAPVAVAAPASTTKPAARAATTTTTTNVPAAAAAPPAVEPAPAPAQVAPRPARPASTTGVVIVPPPLAVIVVDGQHRRVVDGKVVLSCGAHKIRAGVGDTRVVNVPCGGGLSL